MGKSVKTNRWLSDLLYSIFPLSLLVMSNKLYRIFVNYRLGAKSSPKPVSVNKAILKCSHTHSFTSLWLLWLYKRSSCDRDFSDHQSLKNLLAGHSEKKTADSPDPYLLKLKSIQGKNSDFRIKQRLTLGFIWPTGGQERD